MIDKIKRLFENSQSRRIYYSIRNIPPIRLFFDFDYASGLWENGFWGREIGKILNRIPIRNGCSYFRISDSLFLFFLSLCPITALFLSPYVLGAEILILSILFIPRVQKETYLFVFLILSVVSVVCVLTALLSVFLYIIYVETGIILFFIIRFLEKKEFEKFLYNLLIFWSLIVFLPGIYSQALTVFILPYALTYLGFSNIKKYFFAIALLSMGFYSLSQGGQSSIIGGGIGIIILIVLGERWLILPVLVSAPATVSLFISMVRRGIFSEEIVKTSYFFWKYGFGSAKVNLDQFDGSLKIFSSILNVGAFMFFWYVLRVSRAAVIEIFKKKGESIKFLRAGLASLVGFSVYTFIAYNHNFAINIILYLLSATMLRRVCHIK